MSEEVEKTESSVNVEIIQNDDFINAALAKFDPVDVYIAEQRNLAKKLTIAGPDDTASYKTVTKNRLEVKNKRLAMVDRKKELLELPKKFMESIKSFCDPKEAQFKEIEKIYKDKTDAIDKLIEERDRLEADRIENLFNDRVLSLTKLGAKQKGIVYLLAEHLITADEIKSFDEAKWLQVYDEFKFESEKIQKQKEKDDADAEELKRLKALQNKTEEKPSAPKQFTPAATAHVPEKPVAKAPAIPVVEKPAVSSTANPASVPSPETNIFKEKLLAEEWYNKGINDAYAVVCDPEVKTRGDMKTEILKLKK